MNENKNERRWWKSIKDVAGFLVVWGFVTFVIYSMTFTVADSLISIRATARQTADHEKRLAALEEQNRRVSATASLDQKKPVDIAQRP